MARTESVFEFILIKALLRRMVLQYSGDFQQGRYIVMFDKNGEEDDCMGHKNMDLTAEGYTMSGAGDVVKISTDRKFWVPDVMQIRVDSLIDGLDVISWSNRGVEGFFVLMKNTCGESVVIRPGKKFVKVEFYLTKVDAEQTWTNIYVFPPRLSEDDLPYELKPCHLE